jgi:hypothetical protein
VFRRVDKSLIVIHYAYHTKLILKLHEKDSKRQAQSKKNECARRVQFKKKKNFRAFSDETYIDETALCDDSEVCYRRVICTDIGRVSDGWL